MTAARACFGNAGFQATSVDQIAAEAGVSVGLLYRVFKSKMAMIEAIILEQIEQQIEQAFTVISAHAATEIDMSGLLKSVWAGPVDLAKMALMFEIAAEACRNPRLRQFVQTRRHELLSVLMERLVADGLDRPSAEQMFRKLELLGAVATGAAVQSLSNPDLTMTETVEAILGSAR